MVWLKPSIKPDLSPKLKVLPLPLLLSELSILTVPTHALEGRMRDIADGNPFISIEPPRAIALESPYEGKETEELVHQPSLDERISATLALCPHLQTLPRGVIGVLSSCLDNRGYLNTPIEDIAEMMGITTLEAHSVIRSVQDWIEPPGLFATSLEDCLLIQLRRKGLECSDAGALLRFHQGLLLEKGCNDELRLSLGWDKGRFEEALSTLKSLDPYPGHDFFSPRYVIPEVEIVRSGKFLRVRLLRENLPKVTVDLKLLRWKDDSSLKEEWFKARHLITSLGRRYSLVMKVSSILAEQQEAFILGNENSPSPCTLKHVAERIYCHPSTVHRCVTTAWAKTPRGTVILSSLFSRPTRSRPDLSVVQLKREIERMWQDGATDSAISRALNVPRRSVAHHRRLMGLSPKGCAQNTR